MKALTTNIVLCFALTLSFNLFADSDSVAGKFGSTIRETFGDIKDGFSTKGEERDLLNVELIDNDNLKNLTINSAKNASFLDVGLNNGITCYIVSTKPFNGKLVARALDKNGVELGFSEQIVFLDENKGKELVFDFPRALKTELVDKYIIDYQTSNISIEISPKIESELGLRFIKTELPSNNKLKAYIIANQKADHRLVVKAFNKEGDEVNRVAQTIWFADNTETEVTFKFSDISQATRYTIEVDEEVTLPIEVTNSVNEAGLSITRSTLNKTYSSLVTVTSYIIADKDFNGKLIAKALNSQNLEIGRGMVSLTLAEDDAQEVNFNFPQGLDRNQIVKIIIEAKSK